MSGLLKSLSFSRNNLIGNPMIAWYVQVIHTTMVALAETLNNQKRKNLCIPTLIKVGYRVDKYCLLLAPHALYVMKHYTFQ